MIYSGLSAWLKLCLTPGLGGNSQRHLMKTFGLPEQVLAMGHTALRSVIGDKANLLLDETNIPQIEQALEWATQPNHHLIPLDDPRYPTSLLNIEDPPSLLYVRGDPGRLCTPSIAIIGSRNAQSSGLQNARAFAHALSEAGYTIVSGLALGIDAAAHEGALMGAGSTIAIIGTGTDRLYPASNQKLAAKIIAHGTIVSEFPLGTPALPANFPRRNRIISGLSKGVLVVEAAIGSGSLVTARLAIEQGREVMAIPGSIHSPLSKGCHKLIKEGAKLVETAADVLEELGQLIQPLSTLNSTLPNAPDSPKLDPDASAILTLLGFEPTLLDTLIAQTNLPVPSVLKILLSLEMDGFVVSLGGDRYQRQR